MVYISPAYSTPLPSLHDFLPSRSQPTAAMTCQCHPREFAIFCQAVKGKADQEASAGLTVVGKPLIERRRRPSPRSQCHGWPRTCAHASCPPPPQELKKLGLPEGERWGRGC